MSARGPKPVADLRAFLRTIRKNANTTPSKRPGHTPAAANSEIGATVVVTERSKVHMPQGGGSDPVVTDAEIGALSSVTERSKVDVPQDDGTNAPVVTNAEIGASCVVTERSKIPMPQGGGSNPVVTYSDSEIGANSGVTERSTPLLPQDGGATPVVTNSEIGGHSRVDREVHILAAPKRRGRPRKAVSVASMPANNEIGAIEPMTERSMPRVPQGDGIDPVVTNAEIGGQNRYDRKVRISIAPKQRERREAVVPAPLSTTIDSLITLQRKRKFCITMKSRLERSTEAFIVQQLGFQDVETEAESKAIWAKAGAIRKLVERGDADSKAGATAMAGEHTKTILDSYNLIVQAAVSRAPYDEFLMGIIKEMEGLAKQLPVWSWAEGVKGFGPKGLAIIVAEAGADLSEYHTEERLWKRLGNAVIDGVRQGGLPKGSSKEDWILHGYNKPRRAEIWTLADSMFKHQWAGAKDEDGASPAKSKKPIAVAAHPTGPYGEIYAARKRRTAHSNTIITPGHKDNDARRVMMKEFLRDLWRVWNGKPPRQRQLNGGLESADLDPWQNAA